MLLSHPSRHYIYYLFSKRTLDVPAIVAHLGELRLPVPQNDVMLHSFVKTLLKKRKEMHFPVGYNPLEPNEETRAFLKRWKIEGMWSCDEFVGRASDLLFETQIRRMIETLVLGPLSVHDIAKQVQRRFGLNEAGMNTRVVRSYMHYYWDDTALSPDEWKVFTQAWIPGANNDFLLALNAPRTPAGAALAITAADRGGGQALTSVLMYSTARDQGFKMFMEHALHERPSLSRTQAAMYALQIVTQAEEALDKRRGGSAELLEELYKIETIHDHRKMTTVHELPQTRKSLPQPAVIDIGVADPERDEEPAQ
jgi:hypothetical protein